MGIFSRLTDIINSNLNALLDRAEDPQKIIRLIVQEMEDTLVEVRSAAVKFIAEKKEIERRVQALGAERDDWQRKAELALARDREDLARGALAARARIDEQLAGLARQQEQIDTLLAKQNEDIGQLQAKLADAKAREKALAARQASASHRLKLRSHIHDERITDALARFEQAERTLDTLEGKVEAFDLGRKKTLADEFAELESAGAVEEELKRLKAKLGTGER